MTELPQSRARRIGIAAIYVALVAVGAAATFFTLHQSPSVSVVQPLSEDQNVTPISSTPAGSRSATAGPTSSNEASASPATSNVTGTPGSGGGGGGSGGGPTNGPVNPEPPFSNPPPTSEPPPAPTVATVPDVTGFNQSYAEQQVSAAGLFPSVTYEYSLQCYVLWQEPAGGTVLPIGARVDIRVGMKIPGQQCRL